MPTPTTIDAFQGAEGSVDAQKRALLAAIAQQGSAGRASYEAESQAAAQARQAAVQGAAQRAGQIGAPAALASQLAASSPAGGYGADAGAAQAAMGTANRNMATANDTYMEQVKAAIPVSRTLADAYQADALRKQQQEKEDRDRAIWYQAEDRNYEKATREQQHQWAVEDRMYEIAQRDATAKDGNPLANLVDQLGGSDLAKTQLRAVALQALKQAEQGRTQKEVVGGKLIEETIPGHKLSPQEQVSVLDKIGATLGLPPGMLSAFLGKDDPTLAKPAATKPSAETIERVRNKPVYAESVQTALANIRDAMDEEGLTLSEAKIAEINAIRSDAYMKEHPVLRDLVIEALHA